MDLISAAVCALFLLAYHAFLRLRLRKNPMFTVQAVNRHARSVWVEHVMREESRAIVAVQTLRNSTMASTFFASAAVLLMMGALNLVDRADDLVAIFHVVTHEQALSIAGPAKVLFLVADFFIAFFCFAISVRYYNHVSYQIGLPKEQQVPPVDPDTVATHLNHGGGFYTLGMRAYFLSVPLVFWLFSAWLMIASTVVLIAILYVNDRAPSR